MIVLGPFNERWTYDFPTPESPISTTWASVSDTIWTQNISATDLEEIIVIAAFCHRICDSLVVVVGESSTQGRSLNPPVTCDMFHSCLRPSDPFFLFFTSPWPSTHARACIELRKPSGPSFPINFLSFDGLSTQPDSHNINKRRR
jgi:hypothetical protein